MIFYFIKKKRKKQRDTLQEMEDFARKKTHE